VALHDELGEVRLALEKLDRALRPLRERPASRRLMHRLDGDLRRMREDVEDLSSEEHYATDGLVPPARDFVPIPMPPRDLDAAYDPDCEDEGLAGWRSPVLPTPPGAERRR
jgi:hypothetical protein